MLTIRIHLMSTLKISGTIHFTFTLYRLLFNHLAVCDQLQALCASFTLRQMPQYTCGLPVLTLRRRQQCLVRVKNPNLAFSIIRLTPYGLTFRIARFLFLMRCSQFLDPSEVGILLPRSVLQAVSLPGARVYDSSHSYITGQVQTGNCEQIS